MSKEKMAIIVPTKDRREELMRLLGSISSQEIQPIQVIIVDGGYVSVEDGARKFSDLNIDYLRYFPPSLTAQRNAGIELVQNDATHVAFLDDDVVLEKESIKNMMRFWETAGDDVGGAAFNLANVPYNRPTFAEKIFVVNADRPGRILRSGFQSKACFVTETMPCEWLVGCAMVWRKKIFEEFRFDERFSGYARYEEVDFSYRVRRRYKMFIVQDAKVEHHNRLEAAGFSFSLGKMEVVNRLYFVRKNKELSIALCYWGLFGILLNNVIKGILHGDRRYINRAGGNIAGFIFSDQL